MLFDQMNSETKLILMRIKNLKVINKIIEAKLSELIKEHNQVSIKVNVINMIARRSAATAYLAVTLIIIASLYISINTKQVLVRIISIVILIYSLMIDFAIAYLLSLQIKSAHQNLKLIHSLLSNSKMRLTLHLP